MRRPIIAATLGALLVVFTPVITVSPSGLRAGVPHSADAAAPPTARLRDLPLDLVPGESGARPRRSAPIEVEDGTLIVGADWGGDEDVTTELRTRVGDAWGPWTKLEVGDHEGPDPGSAERSTTWSLPVIVGTIDAVQFRTTGASLRARGVVVRAGGGDARAAASPATTTGRTGLALSFGSPVAASTLDEGAARPAIVSRAAWGADEDLRDPRVPSYSPTARFAVVHHTAGTNSYTREQSFGIVRGIYEYHVRGNGWWDIGYNFLIDKYGQVFEGRYGGVDRPVNGAHASGFNSAAIGIAVLGDYRDTPLPAAARASLEQLLAWKFSVHHVDPLGTTTEVSGSGARFEAGRDIELPRIVGHRDVGYTTCPGSVIDLVRSGSIAANVAGRLGTRIHTDSPDRLSAFVNLSTAFTVSTTEVVDWRLDVQDSEGRVVFTREWLQREQVEIGWNHRVAGRPVPAGAYALVVSAELADGRALPSITLPLDLKPGDGPMPISGDWDGDGHHELGWYADGQVVLRSRSGTVRSYPYGIEGDVPIVGDFDGDGIDTVSIIRDGAWHINNRQRGGAAQQIFTYGRITRGDVPVVGDWDGDGTDEIGIIRDGSWHLRYSLSGGTADRLFVYGRILRGDVPIIGDWDRNGRDDIGIVRDGEWHLRYSLSGGPGQHRFVYGRVLKGDVPVIGDWDGNRRDDPGIVRDGVWHLRTSLSGGPADERIDFRG